MSSKGHDSFWTNRNPFVPSVMKSIIMYKNILPILVNYLPFEPLSWGVSNINPFSYFQFSPFNLKWSNILKKVMIKTLNKLINSMLILLKYFQRLFFFHSKSVQPFLQLPIFFCFIMLFTITISLVYLTSLQRRVMGVLGRYFIGHQLNNISLLNPIIHQRLLNINHHPTIKQSLRFHRHSRFLGIHTSTCKIWFWKARIGFWGFAMIS